MDFAIAPAGSAPFAARPAAGAGAARPWTRSTVPPAAQWAVLCLRDQRGREVVQELASFGCRSHAEAFLADLLIQAGSARKACPPTGPEDGE
jgi:hypothetical protein